MSEKDSTRLAHVLETALAIFCRHGFRKTSMEDIAKAAGISRQGIYLNFKNKDEVFSASIMKTLDDGRQATDTVFADERLPLEEKLLKALDEWFGRHVGLLYPEASDLTVHCERILGDNVERSGFQFEKKLEEAIFASAKRKTSATSKRAAIIANMLCACGLTWKKTFASRQEFTDKMRDAIHFCCREL